MITVLGAGVSGLSCGVVLAEAGQAVTIVAAEIVNTTSAAAAAIWLPYHIGSEHVDAWALATREVLTELADDPATGVSLIDFHVFDEERPRCIEDECEPIEGGGFRVRVPLTDTTRYLPYLRERFSRAGGRVEVREVTDIDSVEGDLIVNCTGFGARALVGDEELQPGHGVAVVAPRPAIDFAIVTARAADSLMYVIPRAADCILGGYDSPVPPAESEIAAIVERCRAAVPQVSGEILAVRRGIRPVRPSARLEREGRVIHNYGHGGAGFTVSWGCAAEVLKLVEVGRGGEEKKET